MSPVPSPRDRNVQIPQSFPRQQQGFIPGNDSPGSQQGMHSGQSTPGHVPAKPPTQEYWCVGCNELKPYFNFPIDNMGGYIPGECNAHFTGSRGDPSAASPRGDGADRDRRESRGQEDVQHRARRRSSASHHEPGRQGDPLRWCQKCGKERPKTDFNNGSDGRREPLCKRHHHSHQPQDQHQQNRRDDDDGSQRHRAAREEQRAAHRGSRRQETGDSLAERFQRVKFF